MRHRLPLALLVLGLLLPPALLAAEPPAQPKGVTPLRMIIFNLVPPLAAAQEFGYLEAERLAVTVDVTPSSTAQMQALAAGQYDVARTLFDNLLASATREGVQTVAFAVTDNPDLSLVVRPEVDGYEALRGQPLAADAVDTANALILRKLLLLHGLDYDRGDYALLPVGGSGLRLQSLLRGDTVATMLGPPDSLTAAAAGARPLGHYSEVIAEYPGQHLAATETWLADPANRDAAVRLVRAWQRGAAWAADPANREAAIALVMRRNNTSREGAIAQLDAVATDLTPSPSGLAGVRDLRVDLGLAPPGGPALERFYDLSLVEQARR